MAFELYSMAVAVRAGALRTLKLRDHLGSGVGAEAFLRKLIPGTCVALYYPDDPDFWHEALVLYPSSDDCCHILTPDDDEYVEDLACIWGEGPSRAVLLGPGAVVQCSVVL